MFRRLHVRLTTLYLLVALLLVAVVGGSAYGILRYYFTTTTDLALQHRMAEEFRHLGAPLPPALVAAESSWLAKYGGTGSAVTSSTQFQPATQGHGSSSDDNGREREHSGSAIDAYNGDIAAIYVLPLGPDGTILASLTSSTPSIAPDEKAAAAALANGSDWRTTSIEGTATRLLTYRVDAAGGPVLLQMGRSLADQSSIMNWLVMGLLIMGGATSVILGVGSWWLAGRSIKPAQQAWERQQTFVANAGHEMRTPLTLMRASTEVAMRRLPATDSNQRGLLGDVLEEADHMGRLVDDLLLLSRMDAGRLEMKCGPVDVSDLLADVHRQAGRLAQEREVEFAAEGGGVAWADPARLRQVLLILIDNALRHTPSGGTVSVASHTDNHHVHMTVSDTGEGIEAKHMARLFERFYRADPSRNSESGGSGLGLSIAKGLMEAQGGDIRIESKVGEGTRVQLSLPTRAPTTNGRRG